MVCARVTCSSCSRAYLPSVFFRFIALAQPSIIQTFSYAIIAVQTARPWVMQFLVPEKNVYNGIGKLQVKVESFCPN